MGRRPLQGLWAGSAGPRRSLPPPRPGSVRRTTSLDAVRPEGLDGDLVLVGFGRDVRYGASGIDVVLDRAATTVRIDFVGTRTVTGITIHPERRDVSPLVGLRAGSGFRRALAGALPGDRAQETVLHQLLDDVPVTTMISGGAYGRADRHLPHEQEHHRLPPIGTCAGWAAGAAMALAAVEGTPGFLGEGPPAPDPGLAAPGAWHDLPPLPHIAYRRLRMVDVSLAGDHVEVDAWFRDTFREPDGVETSVHEYSVVVRLAAGASTVLDVFPTAHVLPGPDCHGALPSGARLVGRAVADLRDLVTVELAGPTTCTHLNDVLRSVAATPRLAALAG